MDPSQLQLGGELGRGTFGVTYLGLDKKSGRKIAVKTIDINKSTQLGGDIHSIAEEVQILANLSSEPNCNKYIACYYSSFQSTLDDIPTIFILSEYIDGGSLTSFINKFNGNMQPSIMWPLFLQLLFGLKVIHDRNYAHRDIKPDNILITSDYTIKYIDFGLACNNNCSDGFGTVLYMPPEFFTDLKEDSLEGSKAHDIWSTGIVFYEMANGVLPFPIQDNNGQLLPNDDIFENIVNYPIKSNYTHDDGRTDNFIQSVLIKDIRYRPNIDDCINMIADNILTKVYNP